eukprot:m.25667 g.25667  ORF g.25667 m.25667 type:complete len:51 (-) comp5787_c1_seq1:457-609(-)
MKMKASTPHHRKYRTTFVHGLCTQSYCLTCCNRLRQSSSSFLLEINRFLH